MGKGRRERDIVVKSSMMSQNPFIESSCINYVLAQFSKHHVLLNHKLGIAMSYGEKECCGSIQKGLGKELEVKTG